MNTLRAEISVESGIEEVWRIWTNADDILFWNRPSDEWHTTRAETDLTEGGRFLFRMETVDGRVGFDHSGIYDRILPLKLIRYTGHDGRQSTIKFISNDGKTIITEHFEPSPELPEEEQLLFCQGVLTQFKKYAEGKNALSG